MDRVHVTFKCQSLQKRGLAVQYVGFEFILANILAHFDRWCLGALVLTPKCR